MRRFKPEEMTDAQLRMILAIIEGVEEIDLKMKATFCVSVDTQGCMTGSESDMISSSKTAKREILQEIGRRCR